VNSEFVALSRVPSYMPQATAESAWALGTLETELGFIAGYSGAKTTDIKNATRVIRSRRVAYGREREKKKGGNSKVWRELVNRGVHSRKIVLQRIDINVWRLWGSDTWWEIKIHIICFVETCDTKQSLHFTEFSIANKQDGARTHCARSPQIRQKV
jgi:hypothetical protein